VVAGWGVVPEDCFGGGACGGLDVAPPDAAKVGSGYAGIMAAA
jgi:hypothetical protein